eukprot:TRINITY_DN409_c0_g1_i1.p1 TRINITY_DN409_c0_g1~~TRINITY_DN409_c0_g1_i1.p1  ORF type:complete len:220 (+),score=34.60 TRINITY_DN409_c0_g1_i1:22-660(+)
MNTLRITIVSLLICSVACYDYKQLAKVNLLVKAAVKTQINSFNDALAHYRSGCGTTVPAVGLVTDELKKDASYTALSKNTAAAIKAKLAAVPVDTSSGSISGSQSLQLSSMTLGSYGVSATWSGSWVSTAFKPVSGRQCRSVYTTKDIALDVKGKDYWDFDPNSGYSWVKNLVREKIPGFIASWRAGGNQKPFYITVDFSDNLGKFNVQQCK